MNSGFKGSLYTILIFVVSELFYQLYRQRKNNNVHHKENKSESERRLSPTSLQVLFFPDQAIPCKEQFITGNRCLKIKCQYSHEKTSLSELYRHLMACKETMDVCVYILTCEDLAEILLKLFKGGVKMRIITDKEQIYASGSKILALIKEGIPVRTNQSSFLMHHKFVIIDSKVLINGSFNWTIQAITGNQENVMVTDDNAVTSLFVAEFQKLWTEFDPSKQEQIQ